MPRRRRRFYKIFTDGPNYRPDWRWERANELMSELAPTHGRCKKYCSPQVEGAAVTRLYRYLRKMRMGFQHERRQARIMQEYIDIQEAIAINSEGGVRRLELRLRLFLGQSADVIAKIMDVDAKSVFAYSIYFFDVRAERHRSVLQFRQQHPARLNANSYAELKHDRMESFLHLFVGNSSNLIPMALDAFVHRGEKHDLLTKIGKQREQVELHYLKYLSGIVEPIDWETNLRVLTLIQTSKIGLTSFAKPSFLEHWKAVVNAMPESRATEVVDVDSVSPQQRRKPTEAKSRLPAIWKISRRIASYPRTAVSLA